MILYNLKSFSILDFEAAPPKYFLTWLKSALAEFISSVPI